MIRGREENLERAVLVLFVPTEDEAALETLSGEHEVEGVKVTTVAIGWG